VPVSISKNHAKAWKALSINAFGVRLKYCLCLLNFWLAKGKHTRATKHRSLSRNFAIYGALTPK